VIFEDTAEMTGKQRCAFTDPAAPLYKTAGFLPSVAAAVLVVLAAASCTRTVPGPAEPAATRPVGDVVTAAGQIVSEALNAPDPLTRVNAIEVVAVTRKLRLMPVVERLLRDEFVPVRFAAALAIGDLKYALAREEVAALLSDPNPNVRLAAAYAMYRLGDQRQFDTLRTALGSKDQTVRANAALVLGKTGDKRAIKLLYIALNMPDSHDKVRYQAVESIARLGDERIYEKVWTMLISAYADVRVMGVKAMGALGTTRAHEALQGMLEDDVPEVRLAAAEQLGRLGDDSGQRVVLDVFRKNLTAGMNIADRSRVEVLAAAAIGQICTDRLRNLLPRLLDSPAAPVRLAAARAVLTCIKRAKQGRQGGF